MAGGALATNGGGRGSLETEQQACVSAAVHVIAARAMAAFAAFPRRNTLFRQLGMDRIGDLAGHILVTCYAGVAPHVLRGLHLCRQQWLVSQESGKD